MAIIKTVRALMLGMGHADLYVKREGVATPAGTTNITLPAAGSFQPTISRGKIRARNATVGAASTSKVGAITATDGTTTVQLYGGDAAATAAGQGLDEVLDFATELNLTSITVPIVVTVAACTHDVEVAGVN